MHIVHTVYNIHIHLSHIFVWLVFCLLLRLELVLLLLIEYSIVIQSDALQSIANRPITFNHHIFMQLL